MALQVVRRHRLSERLLTDILHVDLGKAHEVACKIEHDIADEEIMGKIEEALGNPKTCPHGNPIPASNGKLGEDELEVRQLIPLMSLEVSDSGIVERYAEDDPESLERISSIGLRPGDEIEVVRKEPDSGDVSVRLGHGAIHVLSKKMATDILVSRTRSPKRQETRNHRERGSQHQRTEFGEYER